MTKKEAIKELQETHDMMRAYNIDSSESILMTALNTAIEALEQEPCEDAISRQAVLDMMQMRMGGKELYKAVYDLPPVAPIRPKGEWEYDETIQNWRCSKCNETPKTLGYVGTKEFMTEHFKFCNHCGADMRGDKDAT